MYNEERNKRINDTPLLKLSLIKWERLANDEDSDDDVNNCALCTKYYKQGTNRDNYCKGCPIEQDTGKQFCEGSPYEAWSNYAFLPHETTTEDDYISASKLLALDMVKYLQDLLDTNLLQLEIIDYVPSSVPSSAPTVQL